MSREDVWITGIGAATPLGHTYREFAANLLAGTSAVRRIAHFPIDDHPSQIGASIAPVPCPEGVEPQEFAALTDLDRVALWCCAGALRDAGWWERRSEARLGIVLGCAAEWNTRWEEDARNGGRAVYSPQEHVAPAVRRTAHQLGLRGPAVSLSAACASGNYALALARRWLRLGWVDVCLAGACDLALTPMTLAGFGNLRALSRRNDDPTGASRPFDTDRDGFVMGDGGAMFVLERAADARHRGARAYAALAGCGASSDAHHMVIPSPHPEPAIAAMRQALDDARIGPDEVDYVNAHATGTSVGDQAETRVLSAVFGPHLMQVPVSSTKSMTGHLLTGAAAVEALACVVALEQQTVPPTINLHTPDPECRLFHIANVAQQRRVRVTASNSFGFGGSNTCLVLRAA